ncbi:hypothetical protein AAON49_09355 [Pseudotenacibaculum sp. MALMAid0570]|uniref:hypothetical protein n=1 Tax=Pseudotenacibaculum sp. MALMAid0570 TaxID=3143938 RepID=UPI0032DF1639
MKRIFFFISLISIVSCTDQGNIISGPNNLFTGSLELAKTYGGTKNDVGQSVIATSDGGFAVLGYTQSMDGDITDKLDESFDFWLLKFDANTHLTWSKTYGGSDDDRGKSLIQTADGGFAILGYTASSDGDVTSNNGFRDFWLIKTDASGNLSWQKTFGFSGADEGISIIETKDNHFLIIGVLDVTASGGLGNAGRNSSRHAGGDYWAIKVTQNGDLTWSRYFGGSFTDIPNGVIETSNNEFIIAGSSDSNDVDISGNKGTYDFWLVKTAASGNLVWEKSFGGMEIDEARGIAPTSDGNYVVVGDTRSSDQDVSLNNGAADLWLFKMSDSGNLIWNRSIGGSGFDVPRSVKSTSDNGFIIAGSSRSSDGLVANNQGQNDAWIVKVDSNGQLVWERSVGGSEIDFAYDAVELLNGSIIAVGESSSSNGDLLENKGFTDLLIIKLN